MDSLNSLNSLTISEKVPLETGLLNEDINLEDTRIQSLLIDLVFNKRKNIFLSGSGGVGKSYLITKILKPEAERRKKIIAITSTTGVSALGIGGTTIHRWSGIKLGKESVYAISTNIRERNKDCYSRWKDTNILVIDEISMLGLQTFEKIDKVGRNICENELPFGGKQLIVSGDFLQLPPVGDLFCFQSELWEELDFRIFRLIIPKRYPDVNHFELLQRYRMGTQTKEDNKKLHQRYDAYIKYIREGGDKNRRIKPTRLYSLKKDVEQHNLDELSKLPGETFTYNAINNICLKEEDASLHKKKKILSEKEKNDCIQFLDTVVDSQVYLKPEAQVMLTFNLDPDNGLVNGSRGVVVKCHPDHAEILFKNGIVSMIFFNAYEFDDGKLKMIRFQIPLILAWAISGHKSQGCSLDDVIEDLGPSIFSSGMGYVMLSRVRTLDGLLLSNLDTKKLTANKEALKFEEELIQKVKDQEDEMLEDIEGKSIITPIRGIKSGESVDIKIVKGVDKHLIAFLTYDCPEIYEMMDDDLWKKLRGLKIKSGEKDEVLYNRLVCVLGLECEEDENEPGKGNNEIERDLSSEEGDSKYEDLQLEERK